MEVRTLTTKTEVWNGIGTGFFLRKGGALLDVRLKQKVGVRGRGAGGVGGGVTVVSG